MLPQLATSLRPEKPTERAAASEQSLGWLPEYLFGRPGGDQFEGRVGESARLVPTRNRLCARTDRLGHRVVA